MSGACLRPSQTGPCVQRHCLFTLCIYLLCWWNLTLHSYCVKLGKNVGLLLHEEWGECSERGGGGRQIYNYFSITIFFFEKYSWVLKSQKIGIIVRLNFIVLANHRINFFHWLSEDNTSSPLPDHFYPWFTPALGTLQYKNGSCPGLGARPCTANHWVVDSTSGQVWGASHHTIHSCSHYHSHKTSPRHRSQTNPVKHTRVNNP